MAKQHYDEILKQFPFLSLCKAGDEELIGIIQNYNANLASIYVYNILHTIEDKQEFLVMGEEWWWGSNRVLPINLVVGPKFKKFSYCLKIYNIKDFTILHGEPVSLQNIITKRIKRRQIQLVQKL
jgi:hypothetical protein